MAVDQVEGPAWTGFGLEESPGRYPLRVETAVSRIVDRLLPGVITTTRHARMYCLHALVWAEAEERQLDEAASTDLLRRCEAVAAAIHHVHEPHRVALSSAHGEDRLHHFLHDGRFDLASAAARGTGLSQAGFSGVYQGPCVRIGALSPDRPPRRGPRADLAALRDGLGEILALAERQTLPIDELQASGHLCLCEAADAVRFTPKLLVIVGDDQARVAIGSGNLTMAGWHANAELWTVLRADADGGPRTLRQVAMFLRDLASSDVTLSVGVEGALLRTADQLDKLPAEEPCPTLLHSLHAPIAEQLPPDGPVDELVLYAPFHDAALAGARALLDHFDPATWTAYVQLDTEVDGSALAALARQRRGRVAWVSRQLPRDDGAMIPDERYWHGKLVQWRRGKTRWSLTGSPNLSAPALLRTTANGNCELALLHEAHDDLAPLEGDAPPGGVEGLSRTATDQTDRPGLVLLSATYHAGTVTVQLHQSLTLGGVLQRYDIADDLWRTSAPLAPGSLTYQVDLAAAPISQAVRVVRDDHATSNGVFVADPERLRRRQEKAIGKVRATPAEIARLGLGEHLLADLDQLRSHLLRAGATVTAAGP